MTQPRDVQDTTVLPSGGAERAGGSPPRLTGLRRVAARYFRQGMPVAGLVWLAAVAVVAATGSALAPIDPLAQNLTSSLQGPSLHHLLGTDQLGRDILSRLIAGTRLTVLIAAEATGVGAVAGVCVGLFVGYAGGWWDRVIMRLVDAVMAIPGLVLALAILGVFGNNLTVAMAGVGIAFCPFFIRLTRASVLSVKESPYIEAAHLGDLPTWRVLVNHVLPNVAAPLVAQTALVFGRTLLIAAALNFIGLGVQPPLPSWGSMIAEAAALVSRQPFLVVPPGLAIGLTVLASNLVADGLRDAIGAGDDRPGGSHTRHRGRRRLQPSVSPQLSRRGVASADVDDPAAPLLAVDDLVVAFPAPGSPCSIVDSVSFELSNREILGVVGESGSGKTMTALAILGLTPRPCQIVGGSVRFAGRELVGLSERELNRVRGKEIAMVFQEPMAALHPAIRVGHQVAEPLLHHRGLSRSQAQAKAVELLEMAEVPDPARVAAAFPHELSGGLAQRSLIAMALACKPRLLIADEPTTALDVTVQAEILELLRRLRGELDLAVLFVTHDLRVVADICDRVLVMYAGQVVETASVQSLFAPGPHHPYTKGLLAAVPGSVHPPGSRSPVLEGSVPPPGTWPLGCRFAPRCTLADEACRQALPELRSSCGETQLRCIRPDSRLIEVRPSRMMQT